jgi:type III pantothenate kinase
MKRLLVDIGNSRIKIALSDGQHLLGPQAYRYDPANIVSVLECLAIFEPPASVYVASVASESVNCQFAAWCKKRFDLKPVFACSQAQCLGLKNGYVNPASLGVDRWLAMLAGYHHYAAALCVVDCGSALTVDLVCQDGQHMGGMIMPGYMMQRKLLCKGLVRVNTEVTANWPPASQSFWGHDTSACVVSGTLAGLAGAIEMAMCKAAEELGQAPRLLLTGGDAHLVQPWLTWPYDYQAYLVLDGLALQADAE